MAFEFGIIELASITGADPISGSSSDNTSSVGTTVGDVLSFASAGDVRAQTADGDFPDDGGATLIAPVTVNGTTFPAGSTIEADWEIITQDPVTGYYFRITGLYINNTPVGVAISRAWDASVGDWVAGNNGMYKAGTNLTQIDGDDLDGTPNAAAFATDSNYDSDGIGNDATLNSSNGVMVCFADDTLIRTPSGDRLVRSLRRGDRVSTLDAGPQPLVWVGGITLDQATLEEHPNWWPIRIAPGALGDTLPRRVLRVSPQHRLLLRNAVAERMFGTPEVLVAARHLLGLPGFSVERGRGPVTYIHALLRHHQILFAEDAPVESLFLGDQARRAFDNGLLRQIELELPHLRGAGGRPARPLVSGPRARRLAVRLARNRCVPVS